jgi:hypothetical protein
MFAILAVSRTIALLPPPLILLPALENILSVVRYEKAWLRKGLQTIGTVSRQMLVTKDTKSSCD